MFASLIVIVRTHVGQREFNQLRGKAIAWHAHIITDFCNYFHIEHSTRQYLIRLSRENGKRLGLLA